MTPQAATSSPAARHAAALEYARPPAFQVWYQTAPYPCCLYAAKSWSSAHVSSDGVVMTFIALPPLGIWSTGACRGARRARVPQAIVVPAIAPLLSSRRGAHEPVTIVPSD